MATVILFFLAVFLQAVPVGDRGNRNKSVQTVHDGSTAASEELEVHFLDVGQGDATLLICGGHAMLIDAGDNNKGTAVQLYLQKRGVGETVSLDYVIGTHPHSDHIGGLDVIINKFAIGTVFLTNYTTDKKTYLDVVDAMEYYHYEKQVPKPGDTVMLGTAQVTFIAPNREDYENLNNSSIGILAEHGENRFLFLGDAEEEAEQDILQNGIDISDITVYKVSHHGSGDSGSEALLSVIRPEYGVISAGEGNDYGHPHARTLNRLRKYGVKVYRTDEQGSIVAVSDGKTVRFSCPPSDTNQSGR